MANKEVLLGRVFLAIGQGAGDATLSDEAVGTLVDRYSRWLDNPARDGKTPIQVWDEHGKTFLDRFAAIGRALASPGLSSSNGSSTLSEARKVEGESDCPYCPVNTTD